MIIFYYEIITKFINTYCIENVYLSWYFEMFFSFSGYFFMFEYFIDLLQPYFIFLILFWVINFKANFLLYVVVIVLIIHLKRNFGKISRNSSLPSLYDYYKFYFTDLIINFYLNLDFNGLKHWMYLLQNFLINLFICYCFSCFNVILGNFTLYSFQIVYFFTNHKI